MLQEYGISKVYSGMYEDYGMLEGLGMLGD